MFSYKKNNTSKSNLNNKKRSAFTLVEILVIVILVGILASYAIIRTSEAYTDSIRVIKKSISLDLNKYIQKNFIEGYYMEDSFIQNTLLPSDNSLSAHYDATVLLLDALHLGTKNTVENYPNYIQPLTSDSYVEIRSMLNSSHFRDTNLSTGHYILVGDSHKNLELEYIGPY